MQETKFASKQRFFVAFDLTPSVRLDVSLRFSKCPLSVPLPASPALFLRCEYESANERENFSDQLRQHELRRFTDAAVHREVRSVGRERAAPVHVSTCHD